MMGAGTALYLLAGPPRLPDGVPAGSDVAQVLTGSRLPVEGILSAVSAVAWLLWLWIVGSLALELLVAAADLIGHGATWVQTLRRVADRVSVPMARRLV